MDFADIARAVCPVSDQALALVEPLLRPVEAKAGELVIEQGVVSRDIFFVRSGVLRNFALSDGSEHTRWFAGEGDLIASMFSFVHGEPAMSSVEAVTPVSLLALPAEQARVILASNSEWALWAAQYMIEGFYILERRYTYMGTGDAYTRYINLIGNRSADVLRHVKLQHIASYLNITPQTLSRVRRRVARRRT